MKKYFLLLLFLSMYVSALDKQSTLALYEHLFVSLSDKKMPLIYVEHKEYKEIFITSKKMKTVSNSADADIILITNKDTLETCNKKLYKNTICFTTEYHFLKQSKYIVGASYWKKGRAQLLFIENRLKVSQIRLSEAYQKFMIETL